MFWAIMESFAVFPGFLFFHILGWYEPSKSKTRKKEKSIQNRLECSVFTWADGCLWQSGRKSLYESSVSMSDGQRVLWIAVEKFCDLLMLLNLYFCVTFGTLFIWTIKIIKYRLLILSLSANVFIVSRGQDRYWWK